MADSAEMQKYQCWRQERWTLKKCRCAQNLQLHLAPVYCAHMLILHPFEQIFVWTSILLNKYYFEQTFFWTNALLKKCSIEKILYFHYVQQSCIKQWFLCMVECLTSLIFRKKKKMYFSLKNSPRSELITESLSRSRTFCEMIKKWSWSWLFIEQCSKRNWKWHKLKS